MKILTIVGNRPQFIKLGVTARSLRKMGSGALFTNIVVNTGQHYDQMLSDVFFAELEIEAPQYNLGMGSGHIVDQIGRMMAPLREIFEKERPDGLLVYGDTNSTIAGAIVAGHLGVPVVHVEGGERLYRRVAMPEETNRIVTDHLSDVCLASSRKAVGYLTREGFSHDRLRFVGDPMYDIFKLSGEMLQTREAAAASDFGLTAGGFGLCTIHRAENTDDRDICLALLQALDDAQQPVILPAHPRLKHRLEGWGWAPSAALRLVEPLGYFDFQSLLRQAAFIVTDSGGVGREAFFAGKPAIVPLDSSAWTEAVEAGLAVMTGRSGERLRAALYALLPPRDVSALIETNFGEGNAGTRIVEETAACIGRRQSRGEGPWHAIGHFGVLPRATDASMLSHDHFKTLADRMCASGQTANQLLLDVTRSLHGAAELVAIAREAGVAYTLYLDMAHCAYNALADDICASLLRLASGAGLATANAKQAAVLSAFVGRGVTTVPDAPPASDGHDLDSRDPLDDLDDGQTVVRLRPWIWAKIAVTPFESLLRVIDAPRNSALRDIASELEIAT